MAHLIINRNKRLNDGTIKDGQLDEKLQTFRTEPVDEKTGLIFFQFETGGLSVSFKKDMSMEEFANKFEWLAERVRHYKRNGWPEYPRDENYRA